MKNQPSLPPLLIDGCTLTVANIVAVARGRRKVAIAASAEPRIRCCRALVDVLVEEHEVVYGLTTGFGKLRDVVIASDRTRELQVNMIRSHAAGVGDPFPEDVVRAAILLRANTLCKGHSGVRLEVVEALVNMLNDGIYPLVPEKGSVGASGDLIPLAHLMLFLTGDAEAAFFPQEKRNDDTSVVKDPRQGDFHPFPADGALEHVAEKEGWTFRPVTLEAKEGLALINGTQFITAIGALLLHDGQVLLQAAEIAGAMSLEAQLGVLAALDPRLTTVRNMEGQEEIAARIRDLCDGSEILSSVLNTGSLHGTVEHLKAAREYLRQVEKRLGENGRDEIPEAGLIQSSLEGVAQGIREFLGGPSAASGKGLPPRDQITIYATALSPHRKRALEVLRQVETAPFPPLPETHKLRTAVIAALDSLQKAVPDAPEVQDDYSFRCFPQVLGCALRAVRHAGEIFAVEVNSANDNPLLFPPEPEGGWEGWVAAQGASEEALQQTYAAFLREKMRGGFALGETVLSGGNFHGEPLAVVLDYLSICFAEVANIAERRIAHLLDPNHSRGLPPFLVPSSGLNSGLMLAQYTAAALVSENKVLCHPASVDSIPTCDNVEDHVSMGTHAARKAAEILGNVRTVIAIEMLTAFQALHFRQPLRPGVKLRAVVDLLHAHGLARIEQDRVLSGDIERIAGLIERGQFGEEIAVG